MTEHVHVSDLRWDQLLAGELADDGKAEVLAAADACAVCGARLAELRRDSEAFAQRPPFVSPPPVVSRPRTRRWWLAAPAVLAAAAAVLLFVRTRSEPEPDARPKGAGTVQLVVVAGSPEHVVVVASGDRVHPGDHVQAGYTAARDGFGAVIGRDGSGAAATYVPPQGDAMIALPAGTERTFPASTVLDDVPGDETLVVIWCETAHPLAPLVAELAARGDITAPAGCTHRRVVLRKEPR